MSIGRGFHAFLFFLCTDSVINKNIFGGIEVFEWGKLPECDMIINATSLGLKKNDKFEINFSKLGKDKFFFDVIYNPKETKFLKNAKSKSHHTENGKLMFIYQAHQSFTIWHNLMPEINEEVINLF